MRKNQLATTKNELDATCTNLQETTVKLQNELSSTNNKLRETNMKLEKNAKELKEDLSNRAPTLQEVMKEVVHPNQTTTPASYQQNVNRLFELMDHAQVYNINEDECLLKLRLQRNYESLYIYLVEDVTECRNHSRTVFENEDIVLLDGSTWCLVFVTIRKYDDDNSKCFLVDTKQTDNNQLMEYRSYNRNIEWNKYKNGNDVIIFYFKKNNLNDL